jgi:hypothetical protein
MPPETDPPNMRRPGTKPKAGRRVQAALCAFSPTFLVAQRHAVDRRTSRPGFLRSGVTSLLEAFVGPWLRFIVEALPRRGTATPCPELARDMRQMRTFAPSMPIHKLYVPDGYLLGQIGTAERSASA